MPLYTSPLNYTRPMSEDTEEVLALRFEIAHYRKALGLIKDLSLDRDIATHARRALERYPDFNHARPDRPPLPPYKPNSLLDETTT